MKRLARVPRRFLLLGGAGALLLLGTILLQLATPADNGETLPPGTTLSAAPQGSLALSQWLDAEGYDVSRVRAFPFDGGGLDALFVIAPNTVPLTIEDAADLAAYVDRGGTLILATDGTDSSRRLLSALELDVAGKGHTKETATPTGPTLARPTVRAVALGGDAVVAPDIAHDPRFLSRAETVQGAAVATMTRGKGRVHVIADAYPLSNTGLPDADNLAMVQNLLAGLKLGARVGFDEYHHGYGVGASIADLALRSPWGWALAYLAALTLVVFATGGRRFGRPLPAPVAPPRPTADFARALGARWRERHQRAFAATQSAERVKRVLAARFALDPTADDGAFLNALHARRPDLAAECATVLAALHAPAKRDADLIAAVRSAEAFMQRAMSNSITR